MRKLFVILFYLPLFAWSKCQEADRKDFFREHPPQRNCSSVEAGFCIEPVRKVDDELYKSLVFFDTSLASVISEEVMEKWPEHGKREDNSASRIPPDTFLIVDNALRMDLTRRTVFVDCNGKEVYLRDSGGLTDKWNWYGPVSIEEIVKQGRRSPGERFGLAGRYAATN